MKRLGLLLIVVSFLAGAYLSVLDAERVDWLPFGMVLATGLVGVFIRRRALAVDASSATRIETDTTRMRASLDRIVHEVAKLTADAPSMNVYDLPGAIDGRVLEHLDGFVSARDTLKTAYSIQAFADVMTPYAGGERYLNRVWTASADGYVDEAHAYLPRALEQFEEARDRLAALQA